MICELDNLAFIYFPGGWEWIVVVIFGLLIFGKRLPEVGKSLGKSIVEFKKGLKGIEDDMEKAVEQDQTDMLPPPSNSERDNATFTQRSESETENPYSHTG